MQRILQVNVSAVLAGGMLAWMVLAGWGGAGTFGYDVPDDAGRPQKADVLIGFKQTPGAAQENLVRGFGGAVRHTFWLIPTIAATLPETAVEALKKNPQITMIEPDGQVQAIDCHGETPTPEQLATELEYNWGVKHIGAGIVHAGDDETGLKANIGAGIGVAVLDSGIFHGHGEFECSYAGGWNFVANHEDPSDDHWHGTHVSGTIAAGRNGWGVVGAAPNASLYALKTLNHQGSGQWSDVIAALEACVEHNTAVGGDPDALFLPGPPGVVPVPILVTNHS